MRIIHCAPFNIFTKTGGSLYANPVKISQGFVRNGHFVHNFDYRDSARYMSVFRNKNRGRAKMNAFFKSLIDDIVPDLIVFGHAELIDIATYEYAKSKNIRMIFWYNDLPVPPKFELISHFFDAVFATAEGSFMEEMRTYNANSFFMPNLVDESIERYRAFENGSYANDILFTGRADDERQELIRYLVEDIDASVRKKFLGNTKDNVVIGDAYLREIAETKICLNHNRKFSCQYRWFSSDRLMHILGNGSFCLSTNMIGGEDFFEDKLEYYSTQEELGEKIIYYLHHEEERIEKSRWLHRRVHELFNSQRVSKYLLDILNNDIKSLKQYEWFDD
ncbi:MAG: glycosyltransferase [Sulfurimonadaceae bacterium]|nr:glycosyltransferase [Sulfurimonadaceae bacterium]